MNSGLPVVCDITAQAIAFIHICAHFKIVACLFLMSCFTLAVCVRAAGQRMWLASLPVAGVDLNERLPGDFKKLVRGFSSYVFSAPSDTTDITVVATMMSRKRVQRRINFPDPRYCQNVDTLHMRLNHNEPFPGCMYKYSQTVCCYPTIVNGEEKNPWLRRCAQCSVSEPIDIQTEQTIAVQQEQTEKIRVWADAAAQRLFLDQKWAQNRPLCSQSPLFYCVGIALESTGMIPPLVQLVTDYGELLPQFGVVRYRYPTREIQETSFHYGHTRDDRTRETQTSVYCATHLFRVFCRDESNVWQPLDPDSLHSVIKAQCDQYQPWIPPNSSSRNEYMGQQIVERLTVANGPEIQRRYAKTDESVPSINVKIDYWFPQYGKPQH